MQENPTGSRRSAAEEAPAGDEEQAPWEKCIPRASKTQDEFDEYESDKEETPGEEGGEDTPAPPADFFPAPGAAPPAAEALASAPAADPRTQVPPVAWDPSQATNLANGVLSDNVPGWSQIASNKAFAGASYAAWDVAGAAAGTLTHATNNVVISAANGVQGVRDSAVNNSSNSDIPISTATSNVAISAFSGVQGVGATAVLGLNDVVRTCVSDSGVVVGGVGAAAGKISSAASANVSAARVVSGDVSNALSKNAGYVVAKTADETTVRISAARGRVANASAWQRAMNAFSKAREMMKQGQAQDMPREPEPAPMTQHEGLQLMESALRGRNDVNLLPFIMGIRRSMLASLEALGAWTQIASTQIRANVKKIEQSELLTPTLQTL